MKLILKIVLTELILCLIYMLVVSIVNGCIPFLVRGYEPGATTIFGLAVLFAAQFASLILLGYFKHLWLGVVPAALIVWYWINAMSGTPHRSWAFMALSLALFAIHFYVMKKILRD